MTLTKLAFTFVMGILAGTAGMAIWFKIGKCDDDANKQRSSDPDKEQSPSKESVNDMSNKFKTSGNEESTEDDVSPVRSGCNENRFDGIIVPTSFNFGSLEQTPPLDLGSTSLPDGRKIRRVKRASNFMHNSKINKSQAVKPFIGTTIKKFTPVTGTDMINKNGEISNIITKHQCITAMSEYQGKSLEELRSEDYRINGNKPIDSQTGFVFGSPSYRNWFKTFYERSHGSSSSDTINQIFGGPSNNQIFGAPVHNAALESPTTNPVFVFGQAEQNQQ